MHTFKPFLRLLSQRTRRTRRKCLQRELHQKVRSRRLISSRKELSRYLRQMRLDLQGPVI